MLNPPSVKSTPRGSLFRLFIKNLRSEIQNSLTIGGLAPHKLVLKVNCIVLPIRNLNTKEALVNGTRMRIKFMQRNAIDCEVLTGTARNKRILIPRINLTYCSIFTSLYPDLVVPDPFGYLHLYKTEIFVEFRHL
jgi:hypothetical protein